MKRLRSISFMAPVLAAVVLLAIPAFAQDQAPLIPDSKIAALETKLTEAEQAKSSARKKFALRRVIREGDALLERNQAAPDRYRVLGILFRGRRELVALDNSAANRAAFLKTCRQLAAAPSEYATIRLDADLLLSQAELARQGADLQARADALRPLVERYRDTEVEARVIRIAMLMALEFGDTRLVSYLRQVIAERFAGDLEMINFQRDKLAGQVFGAPFIGSFERTDGKVVRFPMDCLGTTTALYFWSKDNGGQEDLEELAAAWKKVRVESKAAGRFQFVSLNLDNLPDAGEGDLRKLGLDWPALKLPGGRDNAIYQAYARRDPALLKVSPTGYAALFLSGGRRSRGYDRNLQSSLARVWTQPRYTSQLQSVFAGEFLVVDTSGAFDPAAPPEWNAMATGPSGIDKLNRTAASVPEDELRAIQACFIKPPFRYRTPFEQVRANYEKADALCRRAIEEHPEAPDLWIVRNRRVIALLGLWKLGFERKHFDAAVVEAKTALDKGYPPGTDVVVRFCLARQALGGGDADPEAVINDFVQAAGGMKTEPALAAAAILSLDAGDRRLHERYRRAFLDRETDSPMTWTAASFLLDRYHRYWLYHPPFVAGWTYGRRQGHFLAIGHPEDARRTLRAEFRTLDGGAVRVPEDSDGKWTVICFLPNAEASGFPRRRGAFVKDRPFEDVHLIAAVLDDDADAVRAALKEKKKPDDFPTLLIPGGMQSPIVHKLGILAEDTRPNIVILRPDGSIAVALSGLTLSAQHGNVIQNVIEWHDEKAVDDALARGDLDEAKRLAFAFAPVEEPTPPDQKKKKPAKKISIPHLRSRAKVYMAMENWQAAFDDIQQTYLSVNSKAGWLSMRTAELDETEKLKAIILEALEQTESGK